MTPLTAVTTPPRSTKTPVEPLTMISLTSGSVIKCAIGRRKGNTSSRDISECSGSKVVEVTGLDVEIMRFEVAVRRRERIRAVIGENDRLGILQFCEDPRLEHVVHLNGVGLRRTDRSAMRSR